MSLSSIISKSLQQEWQSFQAPPAKDVAPAPQVGSPAPVSPKLTLPHDKPSVVVFLRHCGCPFAEKTFRLLTQLSTEHPEAHFVAVSHSSREATEQWVIAVGGAWDVEVIVDEERDVYSAWGLGISNTWHVLSPVAMYSAIRLGQSEGIWNRATESGSRWQTSGAFAVDKGGVVRWANVAATASEIPDLTKAMGALGLSGRTMKTGTGGARRR